MPQQLVTKERIEQEVRKAVAETLGCDADAVEMDKSLIEDLEAQSLDFLDINFRLEQAFGVKMARHFVLEHVEEVFGEGKAIDENSEVTEAAVKLLKLSVLMGDERRQIVAGIARHYAPETLIGKTIVIVANLAPAKIRGIESRGMLLAVTAGETLRLLTADGDVPSGIRAQ